MTYPRAKHRAQALFPLPARNTCRGIALVAVALLVASSINGRAAALMLEEGAIINTTVSNSSVTFSTDVIATSLTVEPTYVYIEDATYTENGEQVTCSVNHTTANSNLDSSEFSCGGSSGDESDSDDSNEWYGGPDTEEEPAEQNATLREVSAMEREEFSFQRNDTVNLTYDGAGKSVTFTSADEESGSVSVTIGNSTIEMRPGDSETIDIGGSKVKLTLSSLSEGIATFVAEPYQEEAAEEAEETPQETAPDEAEENPLTPTALQYGVFAAVVICILLIHFALGRTERGRKPVSVKGRKSKT